MKRHAGLARACMVGAAMALAMSQATADSAGRCERPRAVVLEKTAPYRTPDGSVRIVGDSTLAPLLDQLNALFQREHPEIRFSMQLKEPPTGFDGVMADVSLLAPMARDLWDTEAEAFDRLTGHRPVDVRIGRRGFVAPGQSRPPALYVNAANPVRGIDFAEFGRIFTAGAPPSDIRRWNQLGVGGEWAKHAIHAYGTRDDGKYVTGIRFMKLGARFMANSFEPLPTDADVLRAVAADQWGIGWTEFVPESDVPAGVRMVEMGVPGGPPSGASHDDVQRGRYPLVPYLHFYLHSGPGEKIDPLAAEYIRLALSAEGQKLVDRFRGGTHNFVALSPEEAASECAKLQ